MKKFILAMLLLVCFLALASFAITSSHAGAAPETGTAISCPTARVTSVYTAKLPIQNAAGTNAVRLAVNESTGAIVLAFFQDGKAMGFKGQPGAVLGRHVLVKAKKSFGDLGVAGNSIDVAIDSIDVTSASFSVTFGDGSVNSYVATAESVAVDNTRKAGKSSSEAMTMEEAGRGCTFPDGRVVCLDVSTDNQWWECFWCCAFSPKGGPACQAAVE